MLENSIYSVISPEGCASILWKGAKKAVDEFFGDKDDTRSIQKAVQQASNELFSNSMERKSKVSSFTIAHVTRPHTL